MDSAQVTAFLVACALSPVLILLPLRATKQWLEEKEEEIILYLDEHGASTTMSLSKQVFGGIGAFRTGVTIVLAERLQRRGFLHSSCRDTKGPPSGDRIDIGRTFWINQDGPWEE